VIIGSDRLREGCENGLSAAGSDEVRSGDGDRSDGGRHLARQLARMPDRSPRNSFNDSRYVRLRGVDHPVVGDVSAGVKPMKSYPVWARLSGS